MVFEPSVTFARPPPQPRRVDHPHDPAAGRNQSFGREILNHRVHRGALDTEQSGERFLGELDPVAGA